MTLCAIIGDSFMGGAHRCRMAALSSQCPSGQWGQDCQYLCHCASGQCDGVTGVCADRCEQGWLGGQGHTCQTGES
ncbi:hypothetical protein ACOMHN_046432 [Nucella lapillus]